MFSFSEGVACCSQASMSPTYRWGSWACHSIGRGVPPGPPTVKASMNDLAKLALRPEQYSSRTWNRQKISMTYLFPTQFLLCWDAE